MKIETIKTANLIPYARNSRTHSDAQASQIERWQAFAGKQAIHEATGKTFDEMKAAK
jgi:hypothetical protein